MGFIQGALNVRKDKLENKGVDSVKSRVVNIADCLRENGSEVPDMEGFKSLLCRSITETDAPETSCFRPGRSRRSNGSGTKNTGRASGPGEKSGIQAG